MAQGWRYTVEGGEAEMRVKRIKYTDEDRQKAKPLTPELNAQIEVLHLLQRFGRALDELQKIEDELLVHLKTNEDLGVQYYINQVLASRYAAHIPERTFNAIMAAHNKMVKAYVKTRELKAAKKKVEPKTQAK